MKKEERNTQRQVMSALCDVMSVSFILQEMRSHGRVLGEGERMSGVASGGSLQWPWGRMVWKGPTLETGRTFSSREAGEGLR